MVLFHHTDCAHLPYILSSGELRPSNYPLLGSPPDVLCATTDPNGDRTAAGGSGAALDAYRQGRLCLQQSAKKRSDGSCVEVTKECRAVYTWPPSCSPSRTWSSPFY